MSGKGRSTLTVKALIALIFLLIGLQYLSLLQVNDRTLVRGSGSLFFIVADDEENRGLEQRGRGNPPPLFHSLTFFADMSATNSSSKRSSPSSYRKIGKDGGRKSDTKLIDSSTASGHEPKSLMSECPLIPPGLHGPNKVVTDTAEVPAFEHMSFPTVTNGGRSKPLTCRARHKVAVIVPFRDREDHLRIFLYHIHSLLPRQQLDYGVYVIQQHGDDPFNRAMLLNIGVSEALKQYSYQCFVFHDVDLLPEDDRNIYSCPAQPRHMSVAIDSFLYRLPYMAIFGGVSAMTLDHFRHVNGFSNKFWGWGGEDDDMANRLQTKKLYISRYPANIGRYKMLRHAKDKANPDRFKILYSGTKRMDSDGYNSLRYKRVNLTLNRFYTWVDVELPYN